MIGNTNCKLCAFSEPSWSDSSCKFNIIEYLKDIKVIETKEEYNYIKDYTCKYGLDKKTYNNPEFSENVGDIVSYIVEKAKVSYYLLVNITNVHNNIKDVCEEINNLDIKPRFISFISHKDIDSNNLIKQINDTLDKKYKWKFHNFLESLPLNDSLHIVVDTNIGNNGSKLMMVYDPNNDLLLKKELNDRVNAVQFTSIVQQKRLHGFYNNQDELDGLCLTFELYKTLSDTFGKDVLQIIKNNPELIFIKYEESSH